VHLDGARFFNATTQLGCTEQELAGLADTVSICLSKGLGTPAGSVLTGPSDILQKARRYRKMLGGGMRQAGVLAAAGLHALEHNVADLASDHARASHLAKVLKQAEAGMVTQNTNMIFLTPREDQNDALRGHMVEAGVVLGGGSKGPIRLVMHRNIDDTGLELIANELKSFFA